MNASKKFDLADLEKLPTLSSMIVGGRELRVCLDGERAVLATISLGEDGAPYRLLGTTRMRATDDLIHFARLGADAVMAAKARRRGFAPTASIEPAAK